MSVQQIISPEKYDLNTRKISIFLGGSIELGKVRDWQQEIAKEIDNKEYSSNIVLLNPRRSAWDPSWPVDDPYHQELSRQIKWELGYQDRADILIYFFAAETLSPITLLELGSYSARKPIIFIEPGYLRRANVQITAEHFGWEYYTDYAQFLTALDQRIRLKLQQSGL